ncbi:MAG: GNAT family N-acetyltransferase [Pseudomonadota bacterium]
MTATIDPLVIAPATRNDATIIAEFNIAMALETEDKALDADTVRRGVAGLFDDPARGTYLLARRGDAVAGQIMWTYEWSDWRNGNFWWIQSVYVRPEFRRQGVFGVLFEAVRTRAAAAPDSCGIRLYVDNDNAGAQATYKALGATLTDYALMEWVF